MADYQQIVEDIRGFLQASDQTRTDRLDLLASDYAKACSEVNQRLGRCHRLLQQGLRSEAIQLAESAPRLLDAVETLDFAERNEWDELVEIYSMAGAPKLVVEPRSALNDAYAEAEPLQNLLRNHRRMATQRAPLRQRIGVMRKLAKQDAANPIWSEDLRTFEKARFRQIQLEAAEAARLQDTAHLTRLLSELQESGWIEPPPKSLLQGLSKADAQIRRDQAKTALADIEARLSQALAAADPISGRAARDQWTSLTATVPVAEGDPCWNRVTPALQWLEEEDRKAVATQAYDADLAALSSVLDERRDISAAELERFERDVLRHGRGMPDKLQRRYATRFRSAASVRSRRTRIIVAAAIAGLVLVGGSALMAVRAGARTQAAETAAARVAELIENRDFDKAEDFLENLKKSDANLLSHPKLEAIRQRCKAARNEETERVQKFEDALDEAEQAPLAEVEPKALAQARSLAQLDSERSAVKKLADQRERDRKEASEKRDSGLLDRIQSLIRETDQLSTQLQSGPLPLPKIEEELDRLRLESSKLEPEAASGGDSPRRAGGDLKRKLETVTSRFEERHKQTKLRDEITSAVAFSAADQPGNLVRFADRLEKFVAANPGDKNSESFKQTLKERRLWEAVAAWNGLVGSWKNQRTPLTPHEAQVREKACGEFLAKNSGFAGYDDVEQYRKYLRLIARRNAGAESPTAKIRGLFSDPLIEHTWMIKVKPTGGRQFPECYYPGTAPIISGGSLEFEVLRQGHLAKREFKLEVLDSHDLSPQSKIAAKFMPLFQNESSMERQGGWDSTLIELVRAIIGDREIDPVLQLSMLKTVVNAAGAGSVPMQAVLESMHNQIEKAKVDLDVDWTNPYDRHLSDSQNGAIDLIEALRSKLPTEPRVMAERDRMERAARQIYRTIGWLIRNDDVLTVQPGGSPPFDGDLWVVAPKTGTGAAWQKVGVIAERKLKLDETDRSAQVPGRPVFVIEESR